MAPSPAAGAGGVSEEAGQKKAVGDENEALSANTEDLSEDAQISSKKRKLAVGGRGVANMTPEQLAKKRANDREAQRAIRERTKNQIQTLERRIEELTNQRPYQELQAVVRAKEAVERENAEIKQRLASIVGMLQPMIGSEGQTETIKATQASRSESQKPSSSHSNSSRASPSLQSLQHSQRSASNGGPVYSKSTAGGQTDLSHQREQMLHGLDMGPERLGLGFLLGAEQQVSKIDGTTHNHHDSPQHQHAHVKHDSHSSPYSQASPAPQTGWPNYQSTFPTGFAYQDTSNAGQERRSHADDAIDSGDPNVGVIPRYAAPVRNKAPTCPLDSLLLDFLHERRQRTAEGESVHKVIGPQYPSISSLLNPESSVYSHPLSRVFTDILAKFPDISGLPERVAVLYIMFLIMRWQVSPTRENYERLPPWARPVPSQLYTPHPAWLDHLPFPRMREKLVHICGQPEYHFDNFFIPYTTTLTLSWPYHDTDTLLQSPNTGELMINPVFERHLRNLDNWKLGEAFARALPALADAGNTQTGSSGTSAAASRGPAHTTGSPLSPGGS